IVEDEAYAAREAWDHSIGLSQAVNSELQTHQEQTEIAEHREADRRRQAHMAKTLRVMGDMRREMDDMQAEFLALHGQPRRTRQPGRHARVPNRHDAPRDADRPSTLLNNTNPNNMTLESVQAMIDQTLLQNSTNGDGSHSSHEDNQRNVQTARPCFYADFMKCQPLNFKGTKGMVHLTRWIEKMESVFQIIDCAVENQGEIKKLEIELWNLKYVSGLPDNIYGSVKASKPKTLDETIELANDLMDQKLRTYAERQSNNKRKAGERNPYSGNLPKCTKCHFHHNGPCTQKCHKCNKVGHFASNCRSSGNANVANAQRNNGANPKGNGFFECRATGHFKRDCPKLKNKDGEKVIASGWVYAVGNAEMRGNASRTQIKMLSRVRHPFNMYLMPVELGSFDVIIGMDWLKRCHAVIVCDEKLVRIPYGNETFTFHGNKSNKGRESRLTVILCSKAQEYMEKGCQIFLAQMSAKKKEDKSEGKQLEDVPIVRDYLEVFPKDLPGLPPARPVEFHIDLILGAASVARAPYRLALSEMKELSE
nr:hypothetical protein [Tanacetum cinerariifolium]